MGGGGGAKLTDCHGDARGARQRTVSGRGLGRDKTESSGRRARAGLIPFYGILDGEHGEAKSVAGFLASTTDRDQPRWRGPTGPGSAAAPGLACPDPLVVCSSGLIGLFHLFTNHSPIRPTPSPHLIFFPRPNRRDLAAMAEQQPHIFEPKKPLSDEVIRLYPAQPISCRWPI